MANMYNINGLSYTTKENPEWFTRAMFGGRLVQGGYIRVLTGIKGDELLSMIDLENKILQIDGKDCAWTPNQIIKLSEKTAKVTTYKINLEECIDTLENKRTLYMLSPGAANDALPPELEAATLALIAIGLSNEIEEMIIGGNSTTDPNQFDGLERVLTISGEATHIAGATLTAGNVLAAFAAVYDAFTEDVIQAEDAGTLFMFCSYIARRLLRTAIGTISNQLLASLWTIDDADKKNPRIYYNGVEVVAVKGIKRDTIIGIDATNVFLLTDLLSDLEDVKLGQFPEPNESKIFVKGRLRLGLVVPFEAEAVISAIGLTAQTGGSLMNELRIVPNSLVFPAAGGTKTFTVITEDTAAEITISAAPAGFTSVTKGTTTSGVTTITVVAPANTGNRDPRVGEVDILITGTDRRATATLNQANEDIITITP